MKRILASLFLAAMLASSCGTLSSSTASSSAAAVSSSSMLSFVTDNGTPLEVTVDDKLHTLSSVKRSNWESNKSFRRNSRNAVLVTPGRHDIVVRLGGRQVYKASVEVASREQKVIELAGIAD